MIMSESKLTDVSSFDEAASQIFDSMSALLARAGLEYQGRFTEVNGQRIHYLDYGEGPPVLLLHGGGAGSAIWFRQIEMLAQTRRVIAPDHPVFGLSGQDPYGAPLDESLVSYLNGLMDALNFASADIVGLSMGAQAALALTIEKPERVNRLIMVSGGGLGRSIPLVFRLSTVPLLGRLIVRPNRWGQDNYFKTMEVVESDFEDAATYQQYAYDVTRAKGHARAMRSSLRTTTNMIGQKQVFSDDELRSISTPLLAIWGEHDPVFPLEHGLRLAGLVPSSSLHVVEDAAHVPLLDHVEEVNGLIDGFLG
jgi:pimeloyl-ACP methyl ester carboxylesterase